MITGFWRRSQDADATPHSEDGAIDIAMAYQRLALMLGGICSRTGRRRHGDEDDGGRVRGTQDVDCGGTVRPELDLPTLAGISKTWASSVSVRQYITSLYFVS
jgi:hypothetical protein